MNTNNDKQYLEEARRRVNKLTSMLPSHVSVLDLGVKQLTPHKAVVVRGGLLWRSEELGRAACDVLEHGEAVAGILLSRAVLENAAMIWRLYDLLNARSKMSADDLDKTLSRMLLGSRREGSQEAINILTMVDRLEKQHNGIRKIYDALSEFAHPNFDGVTRSYTILDTQNHIAHFRKPPVSEPDINRLAAPSLAISLMMIEEASNKIDAMLPSWLDEFEPIIHN